MKDAVRTIGGLPLLVRNILAARESGISAVTLLLPDATSRHGISLPHHVHAVTSEALSEGDVRHPVLILRADALFFPDFFHAAEKAPSDTRLICHGETVALLAQHINAEQLRRMPDGFTSEARDWPVAESDWVMPMRNNNDKIRAEQRLLQGLRKASDGFLASIINRRISLAVTRRLMNTNFSPNQMTLISTLIGLAAAPCFLSISQPMQIAGALLFLLHSILDGCDGELARLKFSGSRLGGVLDFCSDNLVHIAVFACMGIGLGMASGNVTPYFLSIGAVVGTLISAALVYAHTMMCRRETHGPLYVSVSTARDKNRLTRLADALSRRDFIYLVLLLALFGKAQWFVIAAGVGAPAFALLLLAIIRKDRRHVRIRGESAPM